VEARVKPDVLTPPPLNRLVHGMFDTVLATDPEAGDLLEEVAQTA
jgi:hypothetical protein